MNKNRIGILACILFSAVAEQGAGADTASATPPAADATKPAETNGKTSAVVVTPKPVGEITRNDIKLTFFGVGFDRGERKTKGLTYPYPMEIEEKNADGSWKVPTAQLEQFLGDDIMRGIVAAKLSLSCQTWANEATPTKKVPSLDKDNQPIIKDGKQVLIDCPTGEPMKWDAFEKFVLSMSARGESLKALQARQNALVLELPSIKDTAELQKRIEELTALAQIISEKTSQD